jgi:methylenetetrahydrofolate reductase (NADPH)
MEFKPPFIDVTTSREEYIFIEKENGLFEKKSPENAPELLEFVLLFNINMV